MEDYYIKYARPLGNIKSNILKYLFTCRKFKHTRIKTITSLLAR